MKNRKTLIIVVSILTILVIGAFVFVKTNDSFTTNNLSSTVDVTKPTSNEDTNESNTKVKETIDDDGNRNVTITKDDGSSSTVVIEKDTNGQGSGVSSNDTDQGNMNSYTPSYKPQTDNGSTKEDDNQTLEVVDHEVTSTSFEIFNKLSPEEQQSFYESFVSGEEFINWYNKAKEEYEKANPSIEIKEGDVFHY